MKSKLNERIVSILVIGLLVLSVLSVVPFIGTAEENGNSVNTEETEITKEYSEYFDINMDLTEEDIQERMQKVIAESKTNRNREKLDLEDPDKISQLVGEDDISKAPGGGEEIKTDETTRIQHNVDDAWDMGYKGDGVKVSLMDTGFDMAQPDIRGKHAVFEYDPSTMPSYLKQYDGYPIAFDPVSISDYLVSGDTASNSWWVNTSYEAMAYDTANMGIVAMYDEKPPENRMYKLPSGITDGETVRFGLHPDDALLTMYGEKPAILLTQDMTGNWTNVYVDLDNDRSFRDEKAAYIGAPKDSEVIAQDINGDGIGDISGGMVTFVSNLNSTGQRMPIPYSKEFRRIANTIINLRMDLFPPNTVLGPDSPGAIEFFTGMDAWDYVLAGSPGAAPYHDKPAPGDLVCLMGDFNGPGSMGAHGTWTASAVVGQGVTGEPGSVSPPDSDGGDPVGTGIVQGLAPNATIIPMGHFFEDPPNALGFYDITYSSMFFTTEGFDGNISTFSDQAQIASSSFGNSYPENVGGHNYYDRLMDYAATFHSRGNTLFVNSEGNEGCGYGTMGAPAGAQAILSVGASSNQYYRVDSWNNYDGGPNPTYGEVTAMTSRGPDSIGAHGVDILTNGQFGYGGDPLNNHAYSMGAFGGEDSYYLWSGTSLSAPNAASIAALVYQAYNETHGARPTAQQVKDFIMQGADDLHNTVFAQGPGIANAKKAIELASDTDGLYTVGTQEWRPGVNPGTGSPTEHNVNMMSPGDSYKESFRLQNMNSSAANYEVSATHLEKIGENHIELDSGTTDLSPWGLPYGTGDQPKLIINDTGMWYPDGTFAGALDTNNCDMIRFGVHTDYEQIKMIDPAFGIQRQALLEYHDWTDVNGNGSYDGFTERNRIGYNWIAMGDYGLDQTSDYFTINMPFDRVHDGFALRARPYYVAPVEFGGGPIPFTLTIEQFNQTTWDWISIDNSTGSIPGDSGIEYNLTANVPSDAPAGLYEGKTMVTNTDTGESSVLPVTITVGNRLNAADSQALDLSFGAGAGNFSHESGIYRNDRVYGNWDAYVPRDGDWRYYYFTLSDTTNGPVAMNLNYDNPLSEVEAYLLGSPTVTGGYEDSFSYYISASRYGLSQLDVLAATERTGDVVSATTNFSLPAGTYMIAVHSKQISGHDDYQEFSIDLYTPGTITPEEQILEYDITSPGDVDPMTNGTYSMIVDPAIDMPNATTHVVGPSRGVEDFYNLQANAGNAMWGDSVFINLAKHQEIECVGVEELIVEITAAASPDLDLGLIYDINGNGVPDSGDSVVATSGTSGSMEYIDYKNPANGTYWAAVNTYTGSAGDPFTLRVEKRFPVGGSFGIADLPSLTAGQKVVVNFTYNLPNQAGIYTGWIGIGKEGSPVGIKIPIEVKLNDNLPGTVTFNTTESTTMITEPSHNLVFHYNDPYFYSGLDAATAEVYVDGMMLPSSAYTIDNVNDKITVVDAYSNLPSGQHSIWMQIDDTSGNTMSSASNTFTVDHSVVGFDVTMMGSSMIPNGGTTGAHTITVEGSTQVWTTGERSEVYVNDEMVAVDENGSYSTDVTISHGYNQITVETVNPYGTVETKSLVVHGDHEIELTVEEMPSLVTSSSVTVSGNTEVGANVTVNGNQLTVDSNGHFSGSVSLSEGSNSLEIMAMDDYGNTMTITKSVTSDTTAPVLSDIAGPVTTTMNTATITGTVDDAYADVYVNGIAASAPGSTSIQATVSLVEGNNTITVVAMDDAGHTTSEEITVEYTPNYATDEDISDIHDQISDTESNLNDMIDQTQTDLENQIDETETNLQDQIDQTETDLMGEIDDTEVSLTDAISGVSSDLSDAESSLSSQIDDVSSQVDTVKSDTDKISDDVNKNADDISSLSSSLTMYAIVIIILMIILVGGVYYMLSTKIEESKESEEFEEDFEEDF